MLTALIIANIALTVGLMTTVKQVRKINKGIEDLGLNIALIQKDNIETKTNVADVQRRTIQIWNMNTNIIELIAAVDDTVDSNIKGLTKSVRGLDKSLVDDFTKGLESISSNLARVEKRNVEIADNITQSKKEIIEEFNTIHKKAIAYPSPLVFLRSKES